MNHEQIERLIAAMENIGAALHRLGNGDAATPMGALEALGLAVTENGERVAAAMADVANAIDAHP